MNSPVGRSYPKRGQRTATSYAPTRRPRRSVGIPRTQAQTTTTTGPSEKWTKVLRHPVSPLDEPYFGSGPTASFRVLTWVKVCDLTEEEKAVYEEAEKVKERERLAWKEAMEERRTSGVDEAGDVDENRVKGTDDDVHRDGDILAQVNLDGSGSGDGVDNKHAAVTGDDQQLVSSEKLMDETVEQHADSGLTMKTSQSDAQDEPMTTETIVSSLNENIADTSAAIPVAGETRNQENVSCDHTRFESTADESKLSNEQGSATVDSEPLRKKRKLTDGKEAPDQLFAE